MKAIPFPSKSAEGALVLTAVLLTATAIGSGSAHGQTFDCRSARAADEVTICHESGLAKFDQDLAALGRRRKQAKRDDVEDNESAFLNARRRCGENRGCIEQSYRNRIQELTRSLSDEGHERLESAKETWAKRQPDGRGKQDSGLESARQPTKSASAPSATNPRPVHEASGSTTEVSGHPLSNSSSRTAQRSKEQQGLGPHIRHELRDQVNSGLVTIILGGLDSGDLSDATELITTLRGPHLRILPVAGEGAAKDVTDLLFARGIDIAIVQTDVLASLKRQAPFPGIENFLQYISKLYDEEVHILVRREIHSLEDLASKPVNFGPLDSGTFLTSSALFGALGLGVEITTFPQPLALDKLRRGEIAALVYTAAKPARLFQNLKGEEGLHFLSISAPEALRERYAQATLSAADYPGLIEQDKPVPTLSVGTVLAVYNWPAGTVRYRNVAHFVDTFFGRLAELRLSQHDPKWQEVDIHASVGGWTRFEAASQWIRTAERVPNKPTGLAGAPFPMEGSTTAPTLMPSAGSGDMEPSATEPAINHPNDASTEFNGEPPHPPSAASPQEPKAQASDQVSFNAGQLDGFFKEFLEYEKQEVQKTRNDAQNQAVFAEFQAYVKQHLQQPGEPPAGSKPRNFGRARPASRSTTQRSRRQAASTFGSASIRVTSLSRTATSLAMGSTLLRVSKASPSPAVSVPRRECRRMPLASST